MCVETTQHAPGTGLERLELITVSHYIHFWKRARFSENCYWVSVLFRLSDESVPVRLRVTCLVILKELTVPECLRNQEHCSYIWKKFLHAEILLGFYYHCTAAKMAKICFQIDQFWNWHKLCPVTLNKAMSKRYVYTSNTRIWRMRR